MNTPAPSTTGTSTSTTRPLRELAAARSGDKGNIACVSVWVYDPAHYGAVCAALTVERLQATHPALWRGAIQRYELPTLHGLQFVFHEALEGGVNASLNLDAHGKSFCFLLLDLPIALDEGTQR